MSSTSNGTSIFDGYIEKLHKFKENKLENKMSQEENKPSGSNNGFTIDMEVFAKKYGLNDTRVSPKTIDAVVVNEEFIIKDTLTICILTVENGSKFTGESACVDPENYREDLGKEIALRRATEKIYMVEGYLLKELQFRAEK